MYDSIYNLYCSDFFQKSILISGNLKRFNLKISTHFPINFVQKNTKWNNIENMCHTPMCLTPSPTIGICKLMRTSTMRQGWIRGRTQNTEKNASILDIYRVYQQFRAVKTHTTKYLNSRCQESNVKYGFSQFYVAEMTGTLSHVTSTCLTSRETVDGSLSWIHESVELWTSSFHSFCVFNTSIGSHGHLFL
jgi:hypothetical protein